MVYSCYSSTWEAVTGGFSRIQKFQKSLSHTDNSESTNSNKQTPSTAHSFSVTFLRFTAKLTLLFRVFIASIFLLLLFLLVCLFFKIGSHYAAMSGTELKDIFLPLPL